jgi:hypothetical protein
MKHLQHNRPSRRFFHFRTQASNILPQLRRNVVGMSHDDGSQMVVGVSALKDRQGAGDHRRRPTHPSAATDERGNALFQQQHNRLDRRAQRHRRLLLAVRDREATIHQGSRKRGHPLFDGDVNHGLDSILQDGLRVAKIACVSEPKSVWEDFSHGLLWFRGRYSNHEVVPAFVGFCVVVLAFAAVAASPPSKILFEKILHWCRLWEGPLQNLGCAGRSTDVLGLSGDGSDRTRKPALRNVFPLGDGQIMPCISFGH